MKDQELKWTTTQTKELLKTPVFDVVQQSEQSGTGLSGEYVAVKAPDWVVVVPVYQDCFVLVRQWRHGEDRLTTEFPGGVVDPGEDPAETAARELLEETGFQAGKLTDLGRCSANPALFKNHFNCFLAEELKPTGEQHLDADELLNYQLVPIKEVVAAFGTGEYTHAYMGTALAFYFRHLQQKDQAEIKTIEDLSLNAWPSHQMQIYDGWILRFSHFYTHRTNCVEQIGSAQIPWEEKVRYCEEIYRRWRTPCIFKITPLTDPAFDELLAEKGYGIQHVTAVMRSDLTRREDFRAFPKVRLENRIPDEWIDALFAIKENATVTHLKIVPSMYAAIPKDVICASIREEGRIVATGLGILDREYIGIYAINVEKNYRRRGFARQICETLLYAGKQAGAKKVYLQVVDDNQPAIALYESLGLTRAYRYWFRVK